jgi:hypothetical protein
MFERLTIKTDICIEPKNEIVYHNPNDPEGMYNILDLAECLYSGGEAEAGILMEISRRLAAYEDSGLSPDEVLELKEEYETEKSNSEATYAIMCGLTEEVERLKKCLAEYEQAKADGRLVGCGIWERMINPFGELEGFMCECGHQSLAATNYCSNCGRKMHGGEAAEKALSPICNTTKLPCAECNPCCEHRKGE